MDTWWATKEVMLFSESLGKIYYCPLKSNRLVDDSGGARPYRHVDALAWRECEAEHGKHIKIKSFPKEHKVTLFRVAVSTHRTDWVVTDNLTQDVTRGAQQACALRWKSGQFHREAKQLTGIERCQCLKAGIQRNHIACAMLVWSYAEQVPRWRAGVGDGAQDRNTHELQTWRGFAMRRSVRNRDARRARTGSA